MSYVKCEPSKKKVCKNCGEEKPSDDFYWNKVLKPNSPGEWYLVRTARCKPCHNRWATRRPRNDRVLRTYRNLRKVDRRKGRENTLSMEYIAHILQMPCTYCGSVDRPTVDRIDNKAGHTPENVVPCCSRCNAIRRDMPIEAWRELAPLVKSLFERGVFKDWIGTPGHLVNKREAILGIA